MRKRDWVKECNGRCVVIYKFHRYSQGHAAINVCFSMTDIFRSEVLGAVMQQLIDESNLPTLFLRTVSLLFPE